MTCGIRTYCAACGEEMIHRDHRQSYEASSAMNQILHREGPADMAVGDIDTYCEATVSGAFLLRLIEHKQPDQELGGAQKTVLRHLDACIRHCIGNPPPGFKLHPESGVFILKGPLEAERKGNHKVNFSGQQIVYRVDGSKALEPKTRKELFDWIRGRAGWQPRNGAGRREWRSS